MNILNQNETPGICDVKNKSMARFVNKYGQM